MSVAGVSLAAARMEVRSGGLLADFSVFGIGAHVGPVSPARLWHEIEKAALALINPIGAAVKLVGQAVVAAGHAVGVAAAPGGAAAGARFFPPRTLLIRPPTALL